MPRNVRPLSLQRRGKLETVLAREQYAPRVSPEPRPRPELRTTKSRPKTREGPNVVSEYFVQKNCRERARAFWKKPWGRYKVDLPLPSYLRDFKYADNQLLRPHFAHYRRNVGVGSNAEESLEMLRSLSAPPYPSVRGDEHAIVGAYEVAGPTEAKARLPMIALPNRVPLENPVEMKKLRKKEFNSDTQHLHSQSHAKKPIRKKASPEKMGLFLDELTEAYALCSAHEQLTAEMETLQQKASKFAASRGKSKLPELNIKPNGALNMLQTILEARKLNST